MQSFFSKLYSFIINFLSVTQIKKILLKLKSYWQSADVPGKMLIAVFFAPSVLVLFWLLAEVAYVIVFTLPGIVIKIISLIFLFCVFWSAAVYFYEKLHGAMSEKVFDAERNGGAQNAGNAQSGETEREKKFTWRRKI